MQHRGPQLKEKKEHIRQQHGQQQHTAQQQERSSGGVGPRDQHGRRLGVVVAASTGDGSTDSDVGGVERWLTTGASSVTTAATRLPRFL